jgi:hypothetical protein
VKKKFKIAEANPADFENALTSRDSLKRSIDLLLFCANPSKDTTSGHCLIEKVKIASI